MNRTQLRSAYLALMTMFALPLLVSVISAQMSRAVTSYGKHDWAYFVAAELLVAGALVRNEIRSRPPAALAEVADRLARAMAAQWSAEAAARKINDPVTLAVPWRVEWDPAGDMAVSAAEMSSIDELFSSIPARRLVVLGGPGAGKTAVLLDLVLKLLLRQDRETGWAQRGRSDRIVPVLFPLSSWSPDQALHDWLVDQLEIEYPELRTPERDGRDSPTRARALVEHDLILPVLDGFDEIAGSQRVLALERIREALHYSSMGIVISSRDEEFRAAAEAAAAEAGAVPDAVVVALEDVGADAAACYLDPGRKGRWTDVFAELGQNSPVGGALRTPLMISLAYAVYNRRPSRRSRAALPDPGQLLTFTSEEEVRSHLFDAFIPAVYRDRPDRAGAAVRWLTYLARYLNEGRDPLRRSRQESEPAAPAMASPCPAGTDLAWWRLRRAVPRPLIGISVGLPAAVAVGVVAGLTPRLGSGLGLGTIAGFTAGAAPWVLRHRSWRVPPSPDSVGAGMAGGFAGSLLGAAVAGLALWATGHGQVTTGLMGSLGVGIGVGVCHGLRRGIPGAVVGGAVVALTAGTGAGIPAGVLDGLGAWLAAAVTVETICLSEPSRGVRGLGWSRAGVLVGATAGIGIGLLAGPVAGLVAGLIGGFAAGLRGTPADLEEGDAACGPAGLLARDRGTWWLIALVGGGAFGLGAGMGVQVAGVGLAAGLTVGLIAASIQAAWLPFTIARCWLAGTGRLPLRLMSFLGDAQRRGVLRQVGGVYQFRHLDLQNRLAGQGGATASPDPPADLRPHVTGGDPEPSLPG